MLPPELVDRLIVAMVPQKVCRVCGEPSRRIVEATHDRDFNASRRVGAASGWNDSRFDGGSHGFTPAAFVTLGFTDCGHNDWRPGVVLFVGVE